MGLRPQEHEFLDASLAARTEDQQVRQVEQRRTTDADVERAGGPGRGRLQHWWLLWWLFWRPLLGAAPRRPRCSGRARETQEAQRLASLSASALSSDPQLRCCWPWTWSGRQRSSAMRCPKPWMRSIGRCRKWVYSTTSRRRAHSHPICARGVHGVWALPVEDLMGRPGHTTEHSRPTNAALFGGKGCPVEAASRGSKYSEGWMRTRTPSRRIGRRWS